jgi:NAD+ synthase
VLAAEALGADNVLAVRLPYQSSSPDSLVHAQLIIDQFKVRSETIDITPMVEPYFVSVPGMSKERKGNIMARARMIVLYDHSYAQNGLVLGTSNKTEILLGYTTLWGDMASAINPIGDLYKTQVLQLSRALNIPEAIINKPPSADLWIARPMKVSSDLFTLRLTNSPAVSDGATGRRCVAAGLMRNCADRGEARRII